MIKKVIAKYDEKVIKRTRAGLATMFKIDKFFDNLKYEKVLPLGSRDVLSGNAAGNNYLA